MATIEASNRDSLEDTPPAIEEQQAFLQPQPSMGSDTARPEGRGGDRSAVVLVWVCSALRPLSAF